MAIEVACPKCGGRLIAEPHALVACPHCRELLTIPSRDGLAIRPAADEAAAAQQRQSADSPPLEDTGSPTDDEPSFPGLPLAESVSADSFLLAVAAAGGTTTTVPVDAEQRHQADSSGSAVLIANDRPATSAGPPPLPPERTAESWSSHGGSLATDRNGVPRPPPRSPEPGAVAAPLAPASIPRRAAGVPPLYFVLVCSYAALATVVLLLIVFVVPVWLRPHQLESLPDIVPKQDAQGEIEVHLYPEAARLPRGHELRLGETGRFGSLEVEPLQVTRGPAEFVHFLGEVPQNGNFERPPTQPVLKLWVRFRNVSRDQAFAPLGSALVFTRGRGKADRRRRGNNFVGPADPGARPRDCVYMFDHAVSGDYDLKDQHVGRGLAPGDEFTTYLPSEEDGLDRLEGELVWRMHVRKGLGPSGWGVTTLVDVRFHSDEIVDESAEPAE